MAARVLAEEMFGDGKNLVQFNMSEFSTRESVTKLIGTAPGYVGFEEGGRLVEALKKNPYSVVLFDEIEKAHPGIADIFLQIFEEGTVTDGQGRSADCSNAVFIMTSNLLTAGESGGMKTIGFLNDTTAEADGKPIRQDKNLCEFFKPELMNRIDEIVVFGRLDREALTRICNRALEEIRSLLKLQGIGLTVKHEVLDSLVDIALREDMGARPLLRIIDKDILDTIAGCMVEQDFKPGDMLEIFRTDGSMKIRRRARGSAPAGEKKTQGPRMARRLM
jgi:ATP-dependent Clp protease ATP-binding subunit ClpA